MTSYRKHRRELKDYTLKTLKTRHKIHLLNNGFLTKLQKERLLKLKKKERETPDSDFWYRIKHSAKFSIFDLELICKIADESQLQEIFEPLTHENYVEIDKGNYIRTDLRHMIEAIFLSYDPEKSDQEDWRSKLALDIVTVGLEHFKKNTAFQSNLHRRLFDDVLDSLGRRRDSTKSVFD